MEKKQSSVEWFEARMLEILSPLNMVMSHEQWEMYDKAHEQAKVMHKEETVDFGNDLIAQNDTSYIGIPNLAEIYYNEIYGNETNKTI